MSEWFDRAAGAKAYPFGSSSFERSREASVESLLDCDLDKLDLRSKQTAEQMTNANLPFTYQDDPDLPGWKRWTMADQTRFNTAVLGALSVRVDSDRFARVRMTPERRHSNLRDHVHGGALLGFIDVAMFAACRGLGVLTAGAAVTLDLSAQFIGGAQIGRPIEAEVELLRETGRMLFVRGLVVQPQPDGTQERVAAFSGTLRKSTPLANPK